MNPETHLHGLSDALIAIASLLGLMLDALGSSFLAYDLLGGENGPLRIILRGVVYGTIFVIGYSLFFNVIIGLIVGVALAVMLGFEYNEAAASKYIGLKTDAIFAVGRACALGSAVFIKCGIKLGIIYSVTCAVTLFIAYWLGHASPSRTYNSDTKNKLSPNKFAPSLLRGAAVGIAGIVAACFEITAIDRWLFFAWLTMAVVTMSATVVILSKFVESYLANVQDRQMGKIGAYLLLAGFLLQTVQYWRTLTQSRI